MLANVKNFDNITDIAQILRVYKWRLYSVTFVFCHA